MHVYMLKNENGYVVEGSNFVVRQEDGAIWVHRCGAENAQKYANFPCEVVMFNLEFVNDRCPTCGCQATYAHGSNQCIKFLKSRNKKLEAQRDMAREERNKLFNEKYPLASKGTPLCDHCEFIGDSARCLICNLNCVYLEKKQ